MNERIAQLYDQAIVLEDGGDYVSGELDPAKFAELLIRECLELISDESEKVSGEWLCKDGQHIWWKVKEHFGVGE